MSEQKRLLNPRQMAEILQVPVSFLYRQNMMKGHDSIPLIKIGKYVRYEPEKVVEWYRQRTIARNNG